METPQDIRAMKKTMLGQNLITELQALLEHEKASIETKMVKMHEQEKAHIDDIDGCWKYMSEQIKKAKEKTSDIISKLKRLKNYLENCLHRTGISFNHLFLLCAQRPTLLSIK
ncbi:hypothetical protein Hanom_Chr04g00293051 [Helianthus anomalus]